MPRLADHAQRRAEIIEASWRVIQRRGIEGATTRAIAEEAGCSLSVLAHYFGGKEELLRSSQAMMYERIVARAFRYGGELLGLAALGEALNAALPLDPERVFDAQVNVAFAAAAMTDPRLAEERRKSHVEIRRLLYGCLVEAREAKELREGVADTEVVDEFIALVEGSALLGLVDAQPGTDMEERLRRLATRFVERLRK